MRKSYYIKKQPATCVTCGKSFRTRSTNTHGQCGPCHLKVYQKEYYTEKRQIPNWNHERYLKFKDKKNTKVQKLYEARITLEKYLDKVQLQREKIKKLVEEVKNG